MAFDLAIIKGVGFGLTSGIITTLGTIVGMSTSTESKAVVIAAVLIIAFSDSLSDAMGVHNSEETDPSKSQRQIWEETVATFVSKFLFALSFLLFILFLPLQLATWISIFWGLSLIAVFSLYIAKQEHQRPYWVAIKHVVVAVIVIFATHYIGLLINSFV